MFNHPVLYTMLLLLAAVVSGASTYFIWRRRATAAARPLVIFMLALTVWSLTYAGYWLASTPPARLVWLNLTYFGVVTTPGAFFAFALVYTRRQQYLSWRVIGLLVIEPLLTLILLWTDPWHGLFFAGKRTAASSTILDGGPWFWLHVVYSYGLMLVGLVMLVQFYRRASGLYRRQTGTVLFAGLLPWFSNIISLLGLNPWRELDLTPMVFTLTGLIITYSLFRNRLFYIVPIARDMVVETMRDGVVVVDDQQRIVDVNPAALPLLAAASEIHVIGEPITRFFPAWPQWLEGDDRVLADITIMRANQPHDYYPIISPVSDHTGRRRGHVLVLRDISERKRTEAALAASEARQRALLSAIPDLIFRYRRDGTYLDVHTRDQSDLLLPPEQFIGKKIEDVLPAELVKLWQERFDRVLATGEVLDYEYTLEVKGQTRYFDARMAACGDDEVISVVRNITGRKQAEQQALELRLEKERVQLLTDFVQNVSHEFRTPLTIIQSTAYLMSRMNEPDKRQQKVMVVDGQIANITRLVDMLVSLSKLDAGVPLDCEVVNLNLLATQVAAQITAVSDQPQAPLKLDLAPGLPSIEGDADRLMEALAEIVGNAVRYTPDQGMVTVRTFREANCVKIEVADSGPGIPAEALPHIFERFYRLDVAHTTPGFGLGLTIAKKIIERHGGHIQVESEPGTGSRFTISLPLSIEGIA